VEDVFGFWLYGYTMCKDFLGHLNFRHPNITFSMALKRDCQLPFLDVLVK
jgi:hypothetical protein